VTSVVVIGPVRRVVVVLIQTIVMPHRLRSALVQAGITDRDGRLPWITWARPKGDAVIASVWLRAGTTPDDLRSNTSVISTACGAEGVEVIQRSARQDLVKVVVYRPRWGLPG
jgi:hypothetical protein